MPAPTPCVPANIAILQKDIEHYRGQNLYYRQERTRLSYWMGTALIAIVVGAGIDNASVGKPFFQFAGPHIMLFQAIFWVGIAYHLYQRLCIRHYEVLGRLAEKALGKALGENKSTVFYRHAERLSQRSSMFKKWFVRIAESLIIFAYLVISIAMMRIEFAGGFVKVAWESFVLPSMAIVILVPLVTIYCCALKMIKTMYLAGLTAISRNRHSKRMDG